MVVQDCRISGQPEHAADRVGADYYIRGRCFMKCSRCGKEINELNHHFIPQKNRREGLRYCIACAREERIVTLI